MLPPRAKSQTKTDRVASRNRSVSPLNMKITGSRYRKRVAESPPIQRISTSNLNVSRMSKNRGRSRIFESDENAYDPKSNEAKQRLFGRSVNMNNNNNNNNIHNNDINNNNNTNGRKQMHNIGMAGGRLVNQTHANVLGDRNNLDVVKSQKGFTSMMRNRGDRSKSSTRMLGKERKMIQRTKEGLKREGVVTQTYTYPEYGGSYGAVRKIVHGEEGSQNRRYGESSKSPKYDRVNVWMFVRKWEMENIRSEFGM